MALEKIEGREDDVFIFEGKNGKEIKLFPDVIRRCVLYVEGIRNYQVIQADISTVKILIEYLPDIDTNHIQKNLTREFNQAFKQFQVITPLLTFGDYVHRTDKKMKRVIRL